MGRPADYFEVSVQYNDSLKISIPIKADTWDYYNYHWPSADCNTRDDLEIAFISTGLGGSISYCAYAYGDKVPIGSGKKLTRVFPKRSSTNNFPKWTTEPKRGYNNDVVGKYNLADFDDLSPTDWGNLKRMYPAFHNQIYTVWYKSFCDYYKTDSPSTPSLCETAWSTLQTACEDGKYWKANKSKCDRLNTKFGDSGDEGRFQSWSNGLSGYCKTMRDSGKKVEGCACENSWAKLGKNDLGESEQAPWCVGQDKDMPGCNAIRTVYEAIKPLKEKAGSAWGDVMKTLSCQEANACKVQDAADNIWIVTDGRYDNACNQDINTQICEIFDINIIDSETGANIITCDQSQGGGGDDGGGGGTTTINFFGDGATMFINKDGTYPIITFVIIGIVGLLIILILIALLGGNKNLTKQVIVPRNHA